MILRWVGREEAREESKARDSIHNSHAAIPVFRSEERKIQKDLYLVRAKKLPNQGAIASPTLLPRFAFCFILCGLLSRIGAGLSDTKMSERGEWQVRARVARRAS